MSDLFSYKTFLRPLLFKIDPEKAHKYLIWLSRIILPCHLAYLAKKYTLLDSRLSFEVLGLHFSSPIGLAAGFDKNAQMISLLGSLGFAFLEIGTLTPQAQEGNPKPRIFRLYAEESLQNAMGFNNQGQEHVVQNLHKTVPFVLPIGINVGKNKATSQEDSIKDYQKVIKTLAPYASYLVVNISSPNTANLRDLQNKDFIAELFESIKNITQKPVFLKIAPDMTIECILELVQCAIDNGASGIIATNTTTDYTLSPNAKQIGGISGALLKEKSFKIMQALGKEFYSRTVLISVGGIDSAKEAYRRIRAGASLVQIYTALIYHGPYIVYEINKGLLALLEQDGFSHITEAIGVDV